MKPIGACVAFACVCAPIVHWFSFPFYFFCFHSYISKVDVLKILVTANYKYVPSLDDILETSAVTRLRNQLLESEYYELAVEVRQMAVCFSCRRRQTNVFVKYCSRSRCMLQALRILTGSLTGRCPPRAAWTPLVCGKPGAEPL